MNGDSPAQFIPCPRKRSQSPPIREHLHHDKRPEHRQPARSKLLHRTLFLWPGNDSKGKRQHRQDNRQQTCSTADPSQDLDSPDLPWPPRPFPRRHTINQWPARRQNDEHTAPATAFDVILLPSPTGSTRRMTLCGTAGQYYFDANMRRRILNVRTALAVLKILRGQLLADSRRTDSDAAAQKASCRVEVRNSASRTKSAAATQIRWLHAHKSRQGNKIHGRQHSHQKLYPSQAHSGNSAQACSESIC